MADQSAKEPLNATSAANQTEVDKQNTATAVDARSSNSGSDTDVNSQNASLNAEGAETTEEAEEFEPQWIEGTTLFVAMMGVTLVTVLILLDMSIVSTAIPKITSQFHSLEDVAWYGSAYTISSATLQPLTGKVYHYFSTKWTFLFFFFIFQLGSLVCGVASSSKMLIVGRAVAGMGSSGIMNGGLTIIAGAVPMHKRAKLIGMMMGIAQLGLVFSPLIGGAFTTYSTWRWCFYINLPVGAVVAVLLIFTKLPDQRAKEPFFQVLPKIYKTFDLIGFLLFAPGSIQLLIALQYGGNRLAWNSATIIGLFCGSGVAFILFWIWEWRMGKEAMFPFHVIKDRIIYCSCLVYMNVFGMTMILSYYLPIYFQSVRGYSAMRSGVNLLPSFVSQLVLAVVSTLLIGKLGYYLPWAVGGAVLNGVGNGLISTLGVNSPAAAWAGYQFFIGFGRGAAVQPPILAVQNAVKPDMLSIAMAILTTSQTFGGALALAFSGVIFTSGLRDLIPETAPTVNPEIVIDAGATAFREVVTTQQLPGVLVAYAKSVNRVFYLAAALCVCQFVFSFGIGWKDISKKKDEKKDEEHQQPQEEK